MFVTEKQPVYWKKKIKDYSATDVEIKSNVALNLKRKRLPRAGRRSVQQKKLLY